MNKLVLLAFAPLAAFSQNRDYPITAVDFTKVHLTDNFWKPRLVINHDVTIAASFERCESTGRVHNFEMAATHTGKFGTVYPFDDTDIYKTIEGASYSLALTPDRKLDLYIDTLIRKIGAAQEPDGYLYTARTIDPAHPHSWAGKQRWEKEREMSHELYNAGHLYEAAAAHFYATGKRTLLNIALKNADLVCSVFGPGKRHVAPGHEIVEMGLVRLYRITGKKEYLETAKDFLYERGHYAGYDPKSRDVFKNGSYWQDHIPVTKQDEAIGHAVRAGYLYSGMADVAALTGDTALLHAVDRIWENMVGKKFYVQGGVGAVGDGERFGDNYELPNTTAYNETCAAIANAFWNERMFLLHGDAKYIDVLERSLYNNVLSGVGLDGKSFFYSNAMQVTNGFNHADRETGRSGWFTCSCCPTNLIRLLPAMPGYIYAQKGEDVFVNLFAAGTTTFNVRGKPLTIVQENDYPWQGHLKFTLSPASETGFRVLLRIPGWARNAVVPSDLYSFSNPPSGAVSVRINGQSAQYAMQNGYALLDRRWKKGDVIEMELPMETRTVTANNNVKSDVNRVAIERGPLMYCAEWTDNGGKAANIIVPAETKFEASYRPQMLGGVEVITASLPVVRVRNGVDIETQQTPVTLIPYYAWANRGKGEMMLWFPRTVTDVSLLSTNTE